MGLEKDKADFFVQAQKIGVIDFIASSSKKLSGESESLQQLQEAIKILRGQPSIEQVDPESPSRAHAIAEEIIEKKHAIDAAEEELRTLTLELSRIEPFGKFSKDDLEQISTGGQRDLRFFCGKQGVAEELKECEDLLYIVSEHGLDYFFAIQQESHGYDGLIEMKFDRTYEELQKAIHDSQTVLRNSEIELKHLAKYNTFLHHALVEEINTSAREQALSKSEPSMEGALFAVMGWVPENKTLELQKIAENLDVHMEEVAIEAADSIPTYLENEKWSRVGEDLVHIYDTPSATDKDPSLWVLFGFLLFFSMIVGDGGYGSVYLGLALYLRYKYPEWKGLKKRVLNLFTLLCIGCIGWGVLTSSFFGIVLPPDNPVRKVSLVTFLAEKKAEYHLARQDKTYENWLKEYPPLKNRTKDESVIFQGYTEKDGIRNYGLLASLTDQILLELALIIGVFHILIGLIRYLPRNYPNFGWILFLLGSLLYFPSYLGAPSLFNYWLGVPLDRGGAVGLQLIALGIPTAVLLSIFKNGLLGLTEIMNLIQVFADVLSYLRLYALGLSGAIVSATINDVASLLPFLLAVILMVIGHMVNMLLGIMGGVIHGLRLNFLEWYHYAFEGGGKKFKPLEIKQID